MDEVWTAEVHVASEACNMRQHVCGCARSRCLVRCLPKGALARLDAIIGMPPGLKHLVFAVLGCAVRFVHAV